MGHLHGRQLMMMQGSFSQRVPEAVPPTLKPLKYCEYRVLSLENPPEVCGTFSVQEVEEMAFCLQHGRLVEHGLAQEVEGVG